MNSAANRLNPFVLMLDPEAVISAMESSRPLRSLRQRVCRPLDKPLIPITHPQTQAFDAAIDEDAFTDGGCDWYAQAQPALHAVH
ncbi:MULTISPECIES: hypothetical protein [Hydrogenophaga]|uniref:Uncharacterized protein n=1 Tax=Hydrogenophaga electricum TaxID=1230953 RepID=A0ABQ6C598_9BURK|nr:MULTISPECIES: hypothetical protein [Hydrogenophaga]GLS15140.1 hypothetical protein GCM10007935_25730 [Hydrogenophaga electricum]